MGKDALIIIGQVLSLVMSYEAGNTVHVYGYRLHCLMCASKPCSNSLMRWYRQLGSVFFKVDFHCTASYVFRNSCTALICLIILRTVRHKENIRPEMFVVL